MKIERDDDETTVFSSIGALNDNMTEIDVQVFCTIILKDTL